MVKSNILDKYKSLSEPVKASLWFVVSSMLTKGMSFITLPLFSRLLTTSEYGIVSVYQSWVATVSIVTTLTLWGGVFNVGMTKYEERKDEMISSFQGLAITITLLFMVVTVPIVRYTQSVFGMSDFLIVCMFVEIMFLVPHNLWATEQRYAFKYRAIVIISLICAIVNPLLGYISVINTEKYKAEARIISALFVQIIIGTLLFARNQLKGKNFFSKEFWVYGFSFNVVLIPHYLSTQILSQSDRIMINNMCGSSDAGIYSVAYNFAMLLSLITTAINSSLTPYVYKTMKTGETENLKKRTTAIILFVAIITVGIICAVPDLFVLLLPDSYYPALKVIPPVTAAAFFFFVHPLFASIEFYYEKNWYVTISSVVGAVLNILLNYIFIRKCGFIAAAYTTLFCYICFTVFHYIFMCVVLKQNKKKNDIYNVKAIVCISLFVVIFALIMQLLYDYTVIRWFILSIVAIFLICYRRKIIDYTKDLLSN